MQSTYLAQFCQHLEQVRSHLAGAQAVDLLPSYIPPAAYWTTDEKDVFFHALSVHSRLRPDLVAACIKTKTVLDVCAYIDALDNMLSRSRSMPPLRSALECAMEVSDSWVQWEERKADDLVSIEPKWEEETLEQQQKEEILSRSSLVENVTPAEKGNLTCDDPLTWKSDRQRYWRQESVLKQLDFDHLTVLEGLLWRAESGILNSDPNEVQSEDQQCHRDGTPILPISSLFVPTVARDPPCSATSDDMIDPVLLHLSGSIPVHILPQPGTDALEATIRSSCKHSPLGFTSSPSPQPLVTFSHPSPNDRSPELQGDRVRGTDPSDLTPVSRRRFQKRLYMRRKRAEQTGEEVILNVTKLRPGRKVKERKPSKARLKSYQTKTSFLEVKGKEDNSHCPTNMDTHLSSHRKPITPPLGGQNAVQARHKNGDGFKDFHESGETDHSEGDDDDAHQTRHNKGGLTRPYKIKKDFAEKGINSNALMEGNLDLFHLSTLGRFMKLYKSGCNESDTTAATMISADTIRLLTTIIEEFTSEVVHRTIISREQDKKMKGDIKVYGRIHDEITPEVVEYVLEMMGMNSLTREKYFAPLLGENIFGTSEVGNTAEVSGNYVDSSDEEQETTVGGIEGKGLSCTHQSTAFPALLPLHRELHPPLIHLPESLTLLTETEASTENDLYTPVHTDEEGLEEELEEEHELDEADSLLAYQYEVDLWKQFGVEHRDARKKMGKRTGI